MRNTILSIFICLSIFVFSQTEKTIDCNAEHAYCDTVYLNKRGRAVDNRADAAQYSVVLSSDTTTGRATVITYFISGQVKTERDYFNLENRILDGRYNMYSKNGQLLEKVNFNIGEIDGKVFQYWENGTLKREDIYANGTFVDGKCFDRLGNETEYTLLDLSVRDTTYLNEHFFPAKDLKEAVYYDVVERPNRVSRRAIRKTYYLSGQLQKEDYFFDYRKKIREGTSKEYTEHGTLIREFDYGFNDRNKEYVAYWDKGALKTARISVSGKNTEETKKLITLGSRSEIIAGNLLSRTITFYDGEMTKVKNLAGASYISVVEKLKSEAERAIATLYYRSGIIKEQICFSNYEKKIKDGKNISVYENGVLATEINYKNGKFDGELVTYWENGNPKRKDVYKNGKKKKGRCFNEKGEKIKYFDYVIAPRYKNGNKAFLEYLRREIKYLPEFNGIVGGRATVSFWVETDGSITDIKTVRSTMEPVLDKIVVETVKALTKGDFIPGKIDGENQRMQLRLPVNFN